MPVKQLALAGSLAAAWVFNAATYAASATPTANAIAEKCKKEAESKNLSGTALTEYVKKCETEAAKSAQK